ncbi:nitroreductase family protein [candidate division KSB1 bacterium]|nr:nitroreductase family protein [candidate division KSB1 bacterium]
MEFTKLIQARYSVRAYESRQVEKEKLAKVLDAARLAPTAANRQPFRFIVIETKGRESKLKQIYSAKWFYTAPIVICACAISEKAWTRGDGINYAFVDTTIAMDHLILAAAELGLGTCWIAAFKPEAAREVLGLPENVDVVAFTPLGYPADQPGNKWRKDLSEIVCYEKWQD